VSDKSKFGTPQECKFLISSLVLKRTKKRMIFQIQITLISYFPYIPRLLNLNRLKETQDPKNPNGNIGTTLQVGLSKDVSKVFTNPP